MTLQEIFISNLKKYRKKRGVSQMALANLCDTSGNYIGEIETGRRIPSFDKIEKIASALHIDAYQLFVEEKLNENENKEPKTKDYLENLPLNVKKEIVAYLADTVYSSIEKSFDPKNYK